MNSSFVTLEGFEYEMTCGCQEQHSVFIHPGDVLTIEKGMHYVEDLGWNFLVTVNHSQQIFMFLEDLEFFYVKGTICSIIDLDLRLNHLQFKINEALDLRDKEAFLFFSNELKKAKELREQTNC